MGVFFSFLSGFSFRRAYLATLNAKKCTMSHCLECGDEIPYGGRKDRKFCSDSCRNQYHNAHRSYDRVVHQRVDNALQKNYRILMHLLGAGLTQADNDELFLLGFRREYKTACSVTNRRMESRCYEISYRESESRIFDIKRIPAKFLFTEGTPPGDLYNK